jgi:ParB family chromosome partitioning protein
MAKKTFDLGSTLAEALGKVSESGTEQLINIPYEKLVKDAENGYSMTGLDDLARNIEIVGLLQPLRVFPIKSSDGHYKIVSGHRRHDAIGMLIENGSKRFEAGVPCVVEDGQTSQALRELKLLLANADNRKLTPADEAQQVERISDCLRKLEDEGFEFPGRHREWVAKLSGLSRTKIATIEAIKNNLIPELLEYYKKNELTQSAANELQKLPKSAQEAIAKSCKQSGDAYWIRFDNAEYCAKHADEFMKSAKCEDGDECDHHERRFVQVLRATYSWQYCDGRCCLKCRDLQSCDKPCYKAAQKKKTEKADEKEQKAARENEAAMLREKENKHYKKIRQEQAKRLLPLIEKAGLDDKAQLPGQYYFTKISIADVRKTAAGDFGDKCFYDGNFLPTDSANLSKMADQLVCSVDYLLGRTKEPTLAVAPQADPAPLQFRSGTPEHDCVCWCAFSFGEGSSGCQPALWKDGKWRFYNINADIEAECVGWIELPDYEGVLRK